MSKESEINKEVELIEKIIDHLWTTTKTIEQAIDELGIDDTLLSEDYEDLIYDELSQCSHCGYWESY